MSTDLPIDLRLSEEQRISREGMRRFASQTMAPGARAADEAAAADPGVLAGIAGFGLTLMSLPAALGGAGLPRPPLGNVPPCGARGGGDRRARQAALAPRGGADARVGGRAGGDDGRRQLLAADLASALLNPGASMLWACVTEAVEGDVSSAVAFGTTLVAKASTIAGALFASAFGI